MTNTKNSLAKIFQLDRTVFTNRDFALVTGKSDPDNIKASLYYFVKTKALKRLRNGIFATRRDYDPLELATSIYTPSYITLETVLGRSGVSFQYYETIFVASYLSRSLEIDGVKIEFVKMKDDLLYNPAGIDQTGQYPIASRERAFLDRIYLTPDYYFDNLAQIDWQKVFELAPIYQNKQLTKRLNSYYESTKNVG